MSDSESEGFGLDPKICLFGIACLVFLLAVSRQVLSVWIPSDEEESLVELREKLADERSDLRKELQAELDEWTDRNSRLELEIADLERSATP